MKGSSLQNPLCLSVAAVSRGLSREKFQGLPPFVLHSFIPPLVVQRIERVPGTLLALQVTQAAPPWDARRLLGSRAAASAPVGSRPGLTWFPVAGGSADAGVRLGCSLAGGGAADAEPAVPEPLLQNPPAFRLCG